VVLTYEDAERLGLSPCSLDLSARVSSERRLVRRAGHPRNRVRVEDITVRDVPAAVAEWGALSTNLLGMSFLGRLSRFELSGNELILTE
jgi:aspartyl protease family protein